MFQSRAPSMNQPYGMRPMNGHAQAGPPLDDQEHWFIQPVPNNRMVLSLECGITSEVTWSLNRLLKLSASDKFNLGQFPTLTGALCHWPEQFLLHYDDEDPSVFSPSPEYVINRKLALNSLLVLRNTAVAEEGAALLARNVRVRTLLFRIIEQFERPNDTTLEFLLSAMDIFRLTIHKWPAAPTEAQIEDIVRITGTSNDRAILIAGWSSLHTLLDTFTTSILVSPESKALNAAIRVLPIVLDQVMVSAALDYILSHVSHPALAKAFLHHPEMPRMLRVLASQLLLDQARVTERYNVMIGVPPRTAIAQNNAIKLLELTQQELDELAVQTEPSRMTKWMQRVYELSPRSEMTQVEMWNLYKASFISYGADNLPSPPDFIKLVTTVFPQANAMVLPGVNGGPQKFVIRGLERRRAAAGNLTKCQWNRWKCQEAPFASSALLYAHVKGHISQAPTLKCLWGSCIHESADPELFKAHLLTHLPVRLPGTRHPNQTDDLFVPTYSDAYAGMPTGRPVPPSPQNVMNCVKSIDDPPSTSFATLLIMRILFRTSFVQAEVVTKTDGEHFGFPGVEQQLADGEAEKTAGVALEDLGFDVLEGQRKGKAAFKAIGAMLGRVTIHDAAISAWIDEMVDSIKALPESL